jgi:hypothetical protein
MGQLERLAEVLALNYHKRVGGATSVDKRNVKLMPNSRAADKPIAETATNVRGISIAEEGPREPCHKLLVMG